ncbi:hypothetical protein BDW22DRAFT_714701 [Trametopsis cervina]|nr:hypothetical protein BDW22DRAFT_714701 [Trametopsis cervina]
MTYEAAIEFLEEAHRLKLIQLFARLIQIPASAYLASPDFISALLRPVALYRDTITTLRLVSRRSEAALLRSTINITRSVWHPTLLILEELKRNPGTQQMWGHIVTVWQQLGKACTLSSVIRDVRNPTPWGELVKQSRTPSSRRACNWAQCLCILRPTHGLRVCKGCWCVFYCDSKCQTQDWQVGGHRELCRRAL